MKPQQTLLSLSVLFVGILLMITGLRTASLAASALTSTPRNQAPTVSPLKATMDALNAMANGTAANRPTPTFVAQEITLNGKPHLIDFNAVWCAPCALMKPTFRQMKKLYGDQLNFWDIDIDNPGARALDRKYRVEYIPLMVLLDKDGKTFRILEGYQTRAQLESAILELLDNPWF